METFHYTDEQFADLQILRYRVEGFEDLTLRQKQYIYFLTEAALQGRDILFHQNGQYNLQIRRLLENIYRHFDGNRSSADFQAFLVYLKRVWFSSGVHHHYGCEKLRPDFSESYLRYLISEVNPQELPLENGESVEEMCHKLFPVIFSPDVMPKRVNQADGEDLLLTSSMNYYVGVTQAEAEAFYAARKAKDGDRPVMHGMNSQLVKEDGQLVEKVWKIGGMYSVVLERIVHYLRLAREVAENERQQKIIDLLIEFYTTGDLRTFDAYSIAWIADTDSHIDFVNGFIESYGDPLGLKSSWEALVNFKDVQATHRTEVLSQHAQWFEDHSPVAPSFKKEAVKGVSAKVIVAAILAGDLYPATAIGINLPNSNWIRSEHGSKSVTISNITDAYDKASQRNGFKEEFVIDAPTLQLIEQYGTLTSNLHTDLHECLGHGSGKLLAGVDADALKAYGATIEEARADLFALYYLPDAEMIRLGLTPDAEAYKAEYYTYLMNGLLTQLVRIDLGNDVEEAHMRNRQLIARWVLAHAEEDRAVELVCRERKTYVQVNDYERLRTLFGTLLAEIQRIKSEGDYASARQLVEQYAVKIDPTLHAEVLERYRALHLAPYKGFINPRYTPVYNEAGEMTDVLLSYDESYTEQMLRYSTDYSFL